jgi:hypothetical protein
MKGITERELPRDRNSSTEVNLFRDTEPSRAKLRRDRVLERCKAPTIDIEWTDSNDARPAANKFSPVDKVLSDSLRA